MMRIPPQPIAWLSVTRGKLPCMRLSHKAYIDHVRADAQRIAQVAARGLEPDVPSCPGWTVKDAVEHTAEVYLHKVACMREKSWPDPWPLERGDQPTLEYFSAAADSLITELTSRAPLEFAETWWWDERTVGFWARRMAHESAIHRVDVELGHDDVAPVDGDLAIDGIDEVLRLMLCGDWSDEPQRDYPPAVVRLKSRDVVWRVAMEPMAVSAIVEREQVYPVDVTISGDPAALDLWLWGRGPDDALTIDGNKVAFDHFNARMRLATQ